MKTKIFFAKLRSFALGEGFQVKKTIDDEINELITHVEEPADRELYTAVLKNQLRYLKQESKVNTTKCPKCGEKVTASPDFSTHKILPRIAVKVLDELVVARDIFGIQPMQGPVGMIYKLRIVEGETNEDDTGTKRLTLQVVSDAVEAQTKKLHACWTIETVQDMKSMHGIDIEEEIIIALASEIAYEIVGEMLATMQQSNVREIPKIDITDVSDTVPSLGLEINKAANDIARKTRRGAGNFVVLSLIGLTKLQCESKSSFKPATKKERKNKSGRLTYCGVLNKTIKVYTDPFAEALAIVGYKGNVETDCGLVYSPYIMIMSAGIVMNPKTFEPVINLMTRYGKSFDDTAQDYYVTLKEAA